MSPKRRDDFIILHGFRIQEFIILVSLKPET
jgi:hypothetical protein